MKTSFLILIICVPVFAQLVSGGSVVKKMNSTYRCCDHPGIAIQPHCSNRLYKDGVLFAVQDPQKGCTPPCKELQDGRVELEQCVDVQVTTICRVLWTDKVFETRTSFTSVPCSGPALAPGSIALVLVLVLVLDLGIM